MLRWLLAGILVLSLVQSGGLQPGLARGDEASADVEAEWKTLVQDLTDFKAKAEDLKLKFTKGTAAEKSKIGKEFQALALTLNTKTLPRMQELAPAIYKKNPEDSVAAELMLQILQMKNQFPEMVKVADGILKKDPKSQMALNYGGIAKFATHDFEGAVKVLQSAESEGLLIPNLAGSYLDSAESYLKYWEEEQAIRAKEDAATGDAQLPIVKLETSRGDIEILLFENEAPNTVANFISLVEKKFYDGLKFHRVIPSFMIQGGCPNSRENVNAAGSGGPGYTIACECYEPNARRHFAGSLSMAHAGKDTGGSQFFLTHLPTSHLNVEPGKDEGNHTVFGRVIKGMDIVLSVEKGDEIKTATVVRKRNHEYKPVTGPDK